MQVDVIAQWNHDGSIIPLRVRFEEEGERHTYTIESHKAVDHDTGNFRGIYVRATDLVWECRVSSKKVWLIWNGKGWRMEW